MKELVNIQSELKAPKNQRNTFGKYNYRSCEDILEAVKPLLKENKCTLVISDEIKEIGGIVFVEAKASILNEKGHEISVTAQAGINPDRKGMDISQSFGSSSSYARKYSLNGLFLIDDTKDADATNNHSSKDNDLDWLPESGVKFENAKKAFKNGITIADIRKKYKVSKKVEQLLNK